MIMFTLDASVTSISTRKSSSRRLGLLNTIGSAATSAMSASSSGRNGMRRRLTRGLRRSRAGSEQARGPDEQHRDEEHVFKHRHPRDRDEYREHALDEAEQDAAHERAGRVAEATEHDDHEALDLVRRAGKDREREQGREQRAAGHGERRADAEREREHPPRVDAHELGRRAVVRHSADALTDARSEEE